MYKLGDITDSNTHLTQPTKKKSKIAKNTKTKKKKTKHTETTCVFNELCVYVAPMWYCRTYVHVLFTHKSKWEPHTVTHSHTLHRTVNGFCAHVAEHRYSSEADWLRAASRRRVGRA